MIALHGHLALISVAREEAVRISELDCVKSMQLERPTRMKMDVARTASGTDKIHSGIDLPQAYTGKGVVAGIVDGGFDPNHINFRGDDDLSRIRYFVVNSHKSDLFGNVTVTDKWYTDDPTATSWRDGDLLTFTTDKTSTFHGTHTLGIMAGNYRGPLQAAIPNGFNSKVTTIDSNPYYGNAYDATIFACAGSEYDALIATGIEQIAEYADQTGLPAVINLSLGGNIGPHDGSSSICQFMDLVAEEYGTIICLAAGNEGDMPIAIKKTLTDDEYTIGTGLYPFVTNANELIGTGYEYYRNGYIGIYSDDPTPFNVSVVVFNSSRPDAKSYTANLTLFGSEDGSEALYASSNAVSQAAANGAATVDANFGKYYEGIVAMQSQVSDGRFFSEIFIQAFKATETSGGTALIDPNDQYALGLVVTGKPGQHISIYSDASTMSFESYGRNGWIDGSTDGTISDIATGKNVIVVGAYNTNNIYGCMDGSKPVNEVTDYPTGKVSSFSSYGTLTDGRTLPHVCAPGTFIISSSNRYYIEDTDNAVEEKDVQAIFAESTDKRHYWQAAMGTSMASPYVAGAIALWLEADPTLTPDEVRQIIESTAVKDDDVNEGIGAQWGAGKFDAYAGLKEVLNRISSIGSIEADAARPMISATGPRSFAVFVAGARSVDAEIFNIAGQRVGSYAAESDELSIDASSLPAGAYIIRINGSYSRRILVK